MRTCSFLCGAMLAASSALAQSASQSVNASAALTSGDYTVRFDSTPAPLSEFDERRLAHRGGSFVTHEELERHPEWDMGSVFISRVPGLRILRAPSGEYPVSTHGITSLKGSECRALTYLDGQHLVNGDVGGIRPATLSGIEYHTGGSIPVRYRMPGSQCGVLLLWTR